MQKPRVQIIDAKTIAKRLAADGVAVFVFVDGRVQAASYGETKLKCKAMGEWLDKIVDGMGSTLPVPYL